LKVLIADDDRDVRDMLELCVASEGFDTATAGDGEQALARLHDGPKPSVILLDLRMPRMNGFEFLRALRRDPSLAGIPVVAITGDTAAVPGALAAGAAACLVKPFDADEIIGTVRRFADGFGKAAA
jgi:CheY-like chemotaxis protein